MTIYMDEDDDKNVLPTSLPTCTLERMPFQKQYSLGTVYTGIIMHGECINPYLRRNRERLGSDFQD